MTWAVLVIVPIFFGVTIIVTVADQQTAPERSHTLGDVITHVARD